MDIKQIDEEGNELPLSEEQNTIQRSAASSRKNSSVVTYRTVFYNLSTYSVSMIAADIAMLLTKWMGAYFIAKTKGTEDLTAYNTATATVNVIYAFGVPISIAALIQISEVYGSYKDLKEKANTSSVTDKQITTTASTIGQLMRHSVAPSAAYGAFTTLSLCFIAPVLRIVGLDASTANKTQDYLRSYALGFAGSFVFMPMHRAYSAVDRPHISTVFNAVCAVITVGCGYLLVFPYQLGAVGYGLAESLGMGTVTVGLAVYMLCDKRLKEYTPRESFIKNLKSNTKNLLAEAVSIAGQNIIYVNPLIYNLLANRLGDTAFAAWSIGDQTNNLIFLPLLGGSQAVAKLISTEVGNRAFRSAYRYGNVALASFTFIAVIECLVLAAWPEAVAHPFISSSDNDDALIGQTKTLMYGLSVFNFFDAVNTILVGNLNGYHDARYAMWVNIVCYSALGIPLSWYLSEPLRMGILGLLAGKTIASSLTDVADLIRWIFINRNPWQRAASTPSSQNSPQSTPWGEFFSPKAWCSWFTSSNGKQSSRTTNQEPLLSGADSASKHHTLSQ
jgi:Na+-driven multidrug efflux pump